MTTTTKPAGTGAPFLPPALVAQLGPEAALAHIGAAVARLEQLGIRLTPAARVGLDEIAEAVAEHYGRNDPAALGRFLARLQAQTSGAH